MLFNAFEVHRGREATETLLTAHDRQVEALDAKVVKLVKLSDDSLVERHYVDHKTRLDASQLLLSRAGAAPEQATRAAGGNILLFVQLADGSKIQVGAVDAHKAEPRAVGPGARGVSG
jgi:hypothetical protein